MARILWWVAQWSIAGIVIAALAAAFWLSLVTPSGVLR